MSAWYAPLQSCLYNPRHRQTFLKYVTDPCIFVHETTISKPISSRFPEKKLSRYSYRTLKSQNASLSNIQSLTEEKGIILLFKNDLRVTDHPGLVLVSQMKTNVIPVYCLDLNLVRLLKDTPGGIEMLWGSLNRLKAGLQSMNSDLIFRIGHLPKKLAELVDQLGCTKLLTETESDEKWKQKLGAFQSQRPFVRIQEWTCMLQDNTGEKERLKFNDISSVLNPIDPPNSIQSDWDGIKNDVIPDLDAFRDLFSSAKPNIINYDKMDVDLFERKDETLWEDWSLELTTKLDSPMEMLKEYISGETKNEILKQAMEETEDIDFPGISFAPLFSLALSLGVFSSRELVHALQTAKDQSRSTWLKRDNFHEAALISALAFNESQRYHLEILNSGSKRTPGSSRHAFWKWYGLTVEYCTALPPNGVSKGNVVLVHGFGATFMHWRRNIDALAQAGYTVYCPSLPGYGRTQTLYMIHDQAVYGTFLSAFIADVVQEPVIIIGNSIGGFFTAQTAAAHPEIISAMILINPAGFVKEDYDPKGPKDRRVFWRLPGVVWDALTLASLWFLKRTAKGILKSLYPVRSENADSEFLEEVLDAASEPIAPAVLKSVFFLKLPPPLNYLLSEMYRKPVLVIQGRRDPLRFAKSTVSRIEKLCQNVEIEWIDAGHCGHDEVPDVVNDLIISYLTNRIVVSKSQSSVLL